MQYQVVGYIRVSSEGQNTDRQLQGIELDRKFIEIQTGSIKERKELLACIDYVREGDTLVVDSIDRLARNLRHLQEIINDLTNKGVSVRFVKENLLFTSNSDPISTLMLQMMGAFAEFERTMIKSRQREGIDAAKKAGKHLGRPAKTTPEMIAKAKKLKEDGVSIRQISFRLDVARHTVYKMLRI